MSEILIRLEDAVDIARGLLRDMQYGYSYDDLSVEVEGFMRDAAVEGAISENGNSERLPGERKGKPNMTIDELKNLKVQNEVAWKKATGSWEPPFSPFLDQTLELIDAEIQRQLVTDGAIAEAIKYMTAFARAVKTSPPNKGEHYFWLAIQALQKTCTHQELKLHVTIDDDHGGIGLTD